MFDRRYSYIKLTIFYKVFVQKQINKVILQKTFEVILSCPRILLSIIVEILFDN